MPETGTPLVLEIPQSQHAPKYALLYQSVVRYIDDKEKGYKHCEDRLLEKVKALKSFE